MATQWKTAASGMVGSRYVGLDYAGVQAGLQLAGITVDREQWQGIQVMEREATIALNERKG